MRRRFVAAALLAPLVILVSAGRSGAQGVPVGATPSTLDSISAGLVELELQRVLPSSASRIGSISASALSSEIATLHARLRALPNGVAADSAAQARVVLALSARAETLDFQIAVMRRLYLDAYPPIREALDQKSSISQRIAEISKR
jgi:hypothetical protein